MSFRFNQSVQIIVAVLLCNTFSSFAQDTERPNIIFVLADDQSWWDYSFMYRPDVEGSALDPSIPNNYTPIYQVAQTPAIDRLADEGLTFTHGYTVPLCRPSLQAMVTGMFPHQNRVSGNDFVGRVDDTAADEQILMTQSIARTLVKRMGYRAFQTGKWWGGHHSFGGFTEGDTVDSVAGGTAPSQYTGSKPGYFNEGRHGDWGLMAGRVDYINDIPAPEHWMNGARTNYPNTIVTLTDFIDDCVANDDPFFAWYAPFLPHNPFDPPPGLREKYDALIDEPNETGDWNARYYANIERLDGGIEALLDHLDAAGIADNTMIIFICDNGWITLPENGKYDPRAKRNPADAGTRTPIIVRWPNKIKPGGELEPQFITQPVSVIDMVTTALAAVDLEPNPEQRGVNLMDLSAVNARDAIYCDVYEHDMVSLENPEETLVANFVVKDGWKLYEFPDGSKTLYHLYDTSTGDPVDPFETADLSGSETAKVAEFAALVEAWYNDPKDINWSTQASQTIGTDSMDIPANLGQSFTVEASSYLAGIKIPFQQMDTNQTITLELRELDGSAAPTGALIDQVTVTPEAVFTNGLRWCLFPFNQPIPVSAGQQLGFQLKTSGQPNAGYKMAYVKSGGYSGGKMYYTGLIGNKTWDQASYDLCFQALHGSYVPASDPRITVFDNEVRASIDMGVKGQPVAIQTAESLTNSWTDVGVDDNRDGLVATTDSLQSQKFYRFALSLTGGVFSLMNTIPPTVANSEAASFTVANDDLLQTALETVNASSMEEGTGTTDASVLAGNGGELNLRNGIWDNNSESRSLAAVQDDEFAEYFFDLTASPQGYNIDTIDLYSNWGTGQGRDEIRVTITLSLVGTPTVFDQVVVTEEVYNPPTQTQGKMSITGIGATGIAGVRFEWPATQENNAVGYSELDVFGAATNP